MKKIISVLLSFSLILSVFSALTSCPSADAFAKGDVNGDGKVNSTDFMQIRRHYLGLYTLGSEYLDAADTNSDGKINSTDFMQVRRHFLGLYNLYENSEIGTLNTEKWVADDVDYSKYDFLGRGEELVKEVEGKYPDHTFTYILEGKKVSKYELDNKVNLMATYTRNVNTKEVTVDIDTIEIRVLCKYTSISAKSGDFVAIEFTTNLPTKFIGSIGNKKSTKGEICHEGITPEGENGTYVGKIKLTVPYVKAGDYYLNISIDSGNAGFPHLLSIPFKITDGEHIDSQFKLLMTGDWDLITAKGYRESLVKLFYNCYPRIYTRFAFGNEPKTITFVADKNYDGVAYAMGTMVVVSVDYANANPRDIGFFSHEITHSAQQYGDKLNYGGDAWWTENLANYGGFRYFHWSFDEYVQVYTADDTSLQDWGYEAYGNNKWFFAYMDSKYPTTKDGGFGLIDSINRLIKNHTGSQLNDDPYDETSPFNAVVKDITGFSCIEELRKEFVKELQNKTWTFTGFGNYVDNYITENLDGVENPDYPEVTNPVHGDKTATPKDAVTSGENLCKNASIYKISGQMNSSESGEKLIDGDLSTKWCSSPYTVNNQQYCLDGTRQWIIIDLGAQKQFNTYTVFNTRTKEYYGNMSEWEVLISDDGENFISVDYQPDCNQDKVSFNIGNQKARYVMLRIYNPDDWGQNTLRFYEFMLFNR